MNDRNNFNLSKEDNLDNFKESISQRHLNSFQTEDSSSFHDIYKTEELNFGDDDYFSFNDTHDNPIEESNLDLNFLNSDSKATSNIHIDRNFNEPFDNINKKKFNIDNSYYPQKEPLTIKKHRIDPYLFIFGAIMLGLSTGSAISVGNLFIKSKQQVSITPDIKEKESTGSSDNNFTNIDINSGFAKAIDKALPSVVAITSTHASEDHWGGIESGSGIIFAEDEVKVFIVTNNHVISNNFSNMKIQMENTNTNLKAKLVGARPENDLAVISVLKSDIMKSDIVNPNIVVADFVSSDNLNIGDFVLAIGNSLGNGTVSTVGILSGKDKLIKVDDITLTVMQTDAAMNPGNSGGALINSKGEVVGINTAKVEEAEGMGYAISTETIEKIISEIVGTQINLI